MLHDRQFAVLKKPVDLPGYRHIPLVEGWILSYHEKLPVYFSKSKQALLLGVAWQVIPGRESPEKELNELPMDETGHLSDDQVMDLEESWCGRYVLICEDRVYLDNAGMLGVFYSRDGLSSSCALLARAMGLEEKRYAPHRVINWMPCPDTQYTEIHRLLPSQVYHFKSGSISGRQLLARRYSPPEDRSRTTEEFIRLFCNSLRNCADLFPEATIAVPLTGGYDSRTIFALARKAGIPFSAFTFEHQDIYQGDVEIPQTLCARTNTAYTYIKRKEKQYAAAREEEYNRQCAGLVQDEDRLFYAFGQYQELTDQYGEIILLRGGLWESTKEFFKKYFDEHGPNSSFYDGLEIEEGSPEKEAVQKYFQWTETNRQEGINAGNRFYWEQRVAGWLSSIELGFDTMEHMVSLHPVNSRVFMNLLFRYSVEDRISKRNQQMMISSACPEIADIPFNNDRLYGQSAGSYYIRKARRLYERIRLMGCRKAFHLYMNILKNEWQEKKYQHGG